MKPCGRCKKMVKQDGFTPSAWRQRGAWCLACFRVYWAEWNKKNPTKYRGCANCNWGRSMNAGICPHEEERVARALLCA